MRKRKTIKIDDSEFTIIELTVRQVWDLVNTADKQDDVGSVERLLQQACPELTREKAMGMAPSELDQIWQAFKEVNAVFLELARAAGLETALIEAIKNEVTNSIAQFVPVSGPATEA